MPLTFLPWSLANRRGPRGAALSRRRGARAPLRGRLGLEELESRVVLDATWVTPSQLASGLQGLSDGLNGAFVAANVLPGKVPILQTQLTGATTLHDQVNPVLAAINQMAGSATTVDALLAQAHQQLGGQFAVTNLVEDYYHVEFDLEIRPNPHSVTVSVQTNQPITVGNFTFSLPGVPGVPVTNNLDLKTHFRVDYYGMAMVTPSATAIDYNPVINYNTGTVQGQVGSLLHFSGSLGLNLAPDFKLDFSNQGSNPVPVSSLAAPSVAVTGGQQVTVPLDLALPLGPLGTFEAVSQAQFALGDFSFTGLQTTLELNGVAVASDRGDPVDTGGLVRTVLENAAGPLFDKLAGIIPSQVGDILLGNTEIIGSVTLKDVLGGQTPIDVAAGIFGPEAQPVADVIDKLVEAGVFANHLKDPNSDPRQLLGEAQTELGLDFPLLDNPIGAIQDFMTGTPTDLVTWRFDLVSEIRQKYPWLTYLITTAPDGAQALQFSFDSGDIASAIDHAVPDLAPLVDYLASSLPHLSGDFYLSAGTTVGIDSNFLTNPTPQGLLDGFYIQTGPIFGLSFDLRLGVGFPPFFSLAPAALGYHVGGFFDDPGAALNQVGTAIGQGAQAVGEGLEHVGNVAADAALNGINTIGDLLGEAGDALGQGLSWLEDAIGFLAHGSISVGVGGGLTISIPDVGSTPGRLTAPEIVNILAGDPLALVGVEGELGVSFDGEGQLLGIDIPPVHAFFPLFSVGSFALTSGPYNSWLRIARGAPASALADPFAEVDSSDPQNLVLRVYGSSDSDTIHIGMTPDGLIEVDRGAAHLEFMPGDVNSILVDLDGSITRFGPATPPADGGNDTVVLSAQLPAGLSVTVLGGSGNDFISAQDETDQFFGGPVTFYGGGGHDTLIGGAGSSYLDGEDGNDRLIAGPGWANLVGGAGDDMLQGVDVSYVGMPTSAGGVMVGGDGNDILSVGLTSAGNWTLIGDNVGGGNVGSNLLLGGRGDDLLISNNAQQVPGGLVADTSAGKESLLFGGAGNDQLFAPAGNNLLVGGGLATSRDPGVDTLHGGIGDLLIAGNATVGDNGHGGHGFVPVPPHRTLPRGIFARLVMMKAGRKKRLMIRVFFSDTGELKAQFRCPFQRPAFRRIQTSPRDTNNDGVPDQIVVTARKGRRTRTYVYAE
jgi:Ca2+-binding RTX toxin-like protein